jgi:hypothetical protein
MAKVKGKGKRSRKRVEIIDFLADVPLPRVGCKFPDCAADPTHPHHVTYRPSCVFRLCAAHHREITVCNINRAHLVRCRLSNRHRWWVWNEWRAGRLRPIFDANAERWMKDFRD